jgi:hypothetical protein
MKRWQGSCLGFLLVALVGGASLFVIVPIAGGTFIGMPPVFDRLTVYALCPDSVTHSFSDYSFGQPTTSRPSGGTGHDTELTCTFEDGSQQVYPNEEVALKGIGASFAAAGICGGAAVLLLAILAAVVGWKLAKPKA